MAAVQLAVVVWRGDVPVRLRVGAAGGGAGDEEVVVLRVPRDAGRDSAQALPAALAGRAGRVRALEVRSALLKTLPGWVGELAGLQELDLHGCSGLTGLPESVGGLTGLQER